MTSSAQIGLGASVKMAGVAFAEVTDIGDYGVTKADIDVTNHDSSGNAEEYISGLIQSGEITITCNLKTSDTAQAAAITACAAGTKVNFLITLANTDASTFQFYGHVKSYRIKADAKGVMKITFVLKSARGAPVFTV